MKKKLLVVFTGPMELGGIEKSLIGLLDAIDYEPVSYTHLTLPTNSLV